MRRREKIVTLAEARAAGLKRYFTGKPCSRGHVVERQVSNQGCLQCLPSSAATVALGRQQRRAGRLAERDGGHRAISVVQNN